MAERTNLRRRPSGTRLAMGLMAGTSLDGVDAAVVQLSGSFENPKFRLLAFSTTPYPAHLRWRLLRVASGEATTAGELSELNFRVGEAFARAAIRLCRRTQIDLKRLTVVGSHGQTVFHQGSTAGKSRSSTLQIGEPALIAHLMGAPVVADFRPADMAAGGEGAPLVPMVDYLVLRDDRQGTVALNIGGVANVTVIPAGARPEQVFGFDSGPGNMVIDALARHFTQGRRQYDSGGRSAARGLVIEPILKRALAFSFFRRRPPKSAGREQFGSKFVQRYFLGRSGSGPDRFEDLLCTATELTARSIAEALGRLGLPPGSELHRLVVSGGGASNALLLARLQALLPTLRVQRSDGFGLPADAKEAIAFAILGDRTLHALPGNLPSVTGAERAVVLGKLVRP
ncbi:MAG TPA: anhydro-N-acetylmuramic acid kinase [Terriglobia bacterium]